MKKFDKKEIYSIPNLLSYFRIILIPIFVVIYLKADSPAGYYEAAFVLFLSGVTDFLDGQIARRCHMITELGKLIDPVADKLTQGAIVLCLWTRYDWMLGLLILYVLKDGFMTVAGAFFLKKGRHLDGAKWYGKVCTFLFYAVSFLLIAWVSIPESIAHLLILLCGMMMAYTLIRYILVYVQMYHSLQLK